MAAPIIPTLSPNASGSDADDSDFAASDSHGSDFDSSSSETSTKRTKKQRINHAKGDEALASGDEGVVESGKRKRRRKNKKKSKGKAREGANREAAEDEEDEEEEEDEGVGARLRRRRDGKGEQESKKKSLGISEVATVDVDGLWQRLNSAPIRPTASPPPNTAIESNGPSTTPGIQSGADASAIGVATTAPDMITIKRTYTFAGTTTTEEKVVPRESAEARLYLSSQPSKPPQSPTVEEGPTMSRPLRRPLRRPSRFDDPDPPSATLSQTTASIKSHLAPAAINNAGMSAVQRKLDLGQKLNTVEKSKLDWAGYVDKEKLKDELDMAEKAKGSYLDRMEFLGRSEQARDEGLRDGRRK